MELKIASPAAAFAGGQQTARALQGQQKANRLADMQYRTASQADMFRNALLQNPGALQGDENALAALAKVDPMRAYDLQQTVASNDRAARLDEMRMEDSRRSARMDETRTEIMTLELMQMIDGMSASEREAEAAAYRRAAAALLWSGGPEKFDALAIQFGQPELVGQYENRDVIAIHAGVAASTLERYDRQNAPEDPVIGPLPEGTMLIDPRRPAEGAMEIPGLQRQAPLPPMEKDVNGQLRFVESGGLVFPDVEIAPDSGDARELRNDFSRLPPVKDFSGQSQAFSSIVASAENPSPAGDLALIFNFMKVLDPQSVVRETEFETAASASAWLQESEQAGIVVPRPVAQGIRQLSNGQRLSDEQRLDFVSRAGAIYDAAERDHNALREQHLAIADANGIPRETAIIDFRYTGPRPDKQQESPQASDEYESVRQRLNSAISQLSPEQRREYEALEPGQARVNYLRQRGLL